MPSKPGEFGQQRAGGLIHTTITVRGAVQGVGFRPFVYKLATSLGLSGFVRNQGGLVYIEVTGSREKVDEFVSEIRSNPPSLARIDGMEVQYTAVAIPGTSSEEGGELFKTSSPGTALGRFVVVESTDEKASAYQEPFGGPGVPPDSAICSKCQKELSDPRDRRYFYPFINCTECGPRFTIVESAPYDRERTTMKVFPMCHRCRDEYTNPLDRRFHAEPNACPDCGPQVVFEPSEITESPVLGPDEYRADDDWLQKARRVLSHGGVLAVKGIGGFHLACDATNPDAVALLRARKRRPAKPFAIMVKDIDTVRRWFYVSPLEEEILTSRAAPIVILRARENCPVAKNVAPGLMHVGVMLPHSPLHLLLFLSGDGEARELTPEAQPELHEPVPEALVMTSGNRSGEPLVFRNEEARSSLGPLVDGFLMHNREIARPCDDSVVRVVGEKVLFYRRSRGWVPETLEVAGICASGDGEMPRVFAAGAEGKNVFAFLSRGKVLLSQHVGDLYSEEGISRYKFLVRDLASLYKFEPDIIAVDSHPGYEVSKAARELFPDKPVVEVQHHHAHMASVMAEHGLKGRCVGIILDGTGYGADGRVWGGEVLAGDYRCFERLYHLAYVPMPGGEKAVAEPWRMALAHLKRAYGDDALEIAFRPFPELVGKIKKLWPALDFQGYPLTSSAGRLFDAVAAITGVSTINTYDGESASLLGELAGEARRLKEAQHTAKSPYTRTACDAMPTRGTGLAHREVTPQQAGLAHDAKPAYGNCADFTPAHPSNPGVSGFSAEAIDVSFLIRTVVEGALRNSPKEEIAFSFHEGLAKLLASYAARGAARIGTKNVVLSGGVFQNPVFTELITDFLQEEGLCVYVAQAVPPNDGGIALGQAVIAANSVGQWEEVSGRCV